MSRFALLRRACTLFNAHDCCAGKRQRRHLQRQWVNAVSYLGDRWIALRLIERKANA